MGRRQDILVVASDRHAGAMLGGWLAGEHRSIRVVDSFAEAKRELGKPTTLLVTQLKLREYNGLHLSACATASGIPAIVFGEPGGALDCDVRAVGAVYLPSTGMDQDSVARLVSAALRLSTLTKYRAA